MSDNKKCPACVKVKDFMKKSNSSYNPENARKIFEQMKKK